MDRKTKAGNQLIYVFIDLFPSNFNTIAFDLSPVFCVHIEETFLSKSGTKINFSYTVSKSTLIVAVTLVVL